MQSGDVIGFMFNAETFYSDGGTNDAVAPIDYRWNLFTTTLVAFEYTEQRAAYDVGSYVTFSFMDAPLTFDMDIEIVPDGLC